MQYPYNFFNSDEAHDYACIEDLKTKVRNQILLADGQTAYKMKKEIAMLFESFDKELANIVEKSLIRNLELWAESLPSERLEIKYSENQVILLQNGKPYTGLSYRVEVAIGAYSYYLNKPCDDNFDNVFSVDGKITHAGFGELLIPYLNVDKWYELFSSDCYFIFNLGCKEPVLLRIGKYNEKIKSVYAILSYHMHGNEKPIELDNQ